MTSCACFCPAEGFSWLGALAHLEPDAFVTPAMPGVAGSGLVGLWPEAEWRMGPAGGLAELKAFCAGKPGPALGFLAYQAGFAGLGVTPRPTPFPDGVFRKYGAVLSPLPDGSGVLARADGPHRLEEVRRLLATRSGRAQPPPPRLGAPSPSMDRRAYTRAVERALEHILDGDAYQLNLSIRFDAPWPRGHRLQGLFTRLLAEHPAMFYGLYHDSPYTLLSTSPERFLRVRAGRVLAQPIKGTRRIVGELTREAAALRASAKERAELSMIVDLLRNDVSAHCAYGSVAVQDHCSVFAVDGLLQMYANVTGLLRPESEALDLLWDALPPGSVTGCPKSRAVELIQALEPHHRDAYCGALVLWLGPRDMDSCVAIRTATLDDASGLFSFFAGSGIVVDSVPDLEYEETLAKAAKFLALAGRSTP